MEDAEHGGHTGSTGASSPIPEVAPEATVPNTVSASDLRDLVSRMVPGSPEAQGAMMFMQYMQQLGMELPSGLSFVLRNDDFFFMYLN